MRRRIWLQRRRAIPKDLRAVAGDRIRRRTAAPCGLSPPHQHGGVVRVNALGGEDMGPGCLDERQQAGSQSFLIMKRIEARRKDWSAFPLRLSHIIDEPTAEIQPSDGPRLRNSISDRYQHDEHHRDCDHPTGPIFQGEDYRVIRHGIAMSHH